MRVVSALVAGVRGAENGSFVANRRGTSTELTVYADFEGYSTLSSDALDSNGSAVAYVAEVADIIVYDDEGVQVRAFTEGDRADCIETVTSAFTGADYDDAQSGVSKPVTLEDVLQLWLTKNGATDWQVLVDGVTSTLPAALSGLAGLFYSVKDAAYGATGDGTTDDSSAIQAAVTAAAAGGIVFFPPGDYLLGGTTITLAAASKCSLMGCGPSSRLITDGTVPNITIARTYANQRGPCVIQGLVLTQNASGTSYNVHATGSGYDLTIRDCEIGSDSYDANACVYLSVAAVTSRVLITGCIFLITGTSRVGVQACHAWGWNLKISDNEFVLPAAYTTSVIVADSGNINGNVFKCSVVASGTTCLVSTTGDGQASTDCLVVTGNRSTGNNGGTVTALSISDPARLVESGNAWDDCAISVDSSTDLPGDDYQGYLGAREGRSCSVVASGDTITLNPNDYAAFVVGRTTGTELTATLTAPLYPGMHAAITWRNGHADTDFDVVGVGVVGSSVGTDAWGTIVAQNSCTWLLVSQEKGAGGYVWVLVSASNAALGSL